MKPDFSRISLKGATNKLEDSVITLSGPALAFSGILAGVDLVTNGSIMSHTAWLGLVWAICLLISLDFQVLSLGARAKQVYLSSEKPTARKVNELVLTFAIAGGISYVSIQMQSIIARVNSVPGLSIEQATTQLGISPLALIWERSALVLLLIFLSGWFRDDEKHSETPALATVPSETPAPTVAIIVPIRVTRLHHQMAVWQAVHTVTVVETVEQVPLLQEFAESFEQDNVLTDNRQPINIQSARELSQLTEKSQRVKELLTQEPHLSQSEIAKLTGVSRAYVSQVNKRMQVNPLVKGLDR